MDELPFKKDGLRAGRDHGTNNSTLQKSKPVTIPNKWPWDAKDPAVSPYLHITVNYQSSAGPPRSPFHREYRPAPMDTVHTDN